MLFFKKTNIKLLTLILLLSILGTTGVIYAKNLEIEKYYSTLSEIKENIITSDNITVPFYSLKKIDDKYKVVYKELPGEVLENSSNIDSSKNLSYEKSIIKNYYNTVSLIPEYVDYSEYNNEFNSTFSGTLYLKTINVYENVYVAKYIGVIKSTEKMN